MCLSVAKSVSLPVYLAIVMYAARILFEQGYLIYVGTALGVLAFIGLALSNARLPILAIATLFVAGISYIFSYANNGLGYGAFFVPHLLSAVGISWHIQRNGISYHFCAALFYGSVAYCLAGFLIYQLEPADLMRGSRNQVSVYFLSTSALLYIAAERLSTRVSLVPAIITLFIATISVGIGGIVSATLLFSLLLYFRLFHKVRGYKYLLPVFILIASQLLFVYWEIIAVFFITSFGIEGDLVNKLNVFQLLEENDRYLIWNDYLENLTLQRFVSGINLGESFYGVANLHSAYLLMHARMGIFAFMLFVLFANGLFARFQQSFVLASCAASLLLRGVTDTTFFAGSSFDFVLIYLLLFIHDPKVYPATTRSTYREEAIGTYK